METLQDRLQGLVKESGLSIRALARKIGVSDVSLGHWVSGKYRPKEDGVAAIRWSQLSRTAIV